MRYRIMRLRWWLARRIAPTDITNDAFPGHKGVVVAYHDGDGLCWSMKATTFDLEATNGINARRFADEFPRYPMPNITGTHITFRGTVEP